MPRRFAPCRHHKSNERRVRQLDAPYIERRGTGREAGPKGSERLPWSRYGQNDRQIVVGRKNYYGNGSVWSGMLTAMLFSLFQTLLKKEIDPQKFLKHYFEACAENGGRVPENLAAFFPWNLSEEEKSAWRYQKKPP